MKIYRIKCDKCGKEVEMRKAKQISIGPQNQDRVMTCAPENMINANSIAYSTFTLDLCNECVKGFLNTIPGTESYADRL